MSSKDPSHINVDTLPHSPSSPLWEGPNKSVTRMSGGGPVVTLPAQPETTTGKALKQLSHGLQALVESNSSLEDVQLFIRRYEVCDSSGDSAARIHPLVQEWFDYRDTLKMAIERDRDDIVRYLLDRNFKIDGETILAICRKRPDLVKTLIEQGRWEINDPTSQIMPPILGAFVSNYEMLEWLLARGANVEAVSPDGKYTIFHRAAQYSPVPCLALLLSVAPSSILPGSYSADVIFHAACAHGPKNNRIPIIQFLLDNGAPIDMVAGCGRYEDLQAHLCDLFACGRKNGLHWAVEHGKLDLVKFLLEQGADVGKTTWSLATNSRWVTVEELATMCGHDDVRAVVTSYDSGAEAAS